MPDYDFLSLSPLDFEELSRDLLQKELGRTFESFATGRDGGVDFRYSAATGGDAVVRCKRYVGWSSLETVLKKEEKKVRKLTPDRYFLVTSASLAFANKRDIKKLFCPYIRDTSDIYGREDLNNLLGKFPDIEKKHFKLWLANTNILEAIVHSRVENQTLFELDEMKHAIRVYVENESFLKATRILNERRCVVISGIPGIGKTTLARMLVSNCLAEDFEKLVFVSGSIGEAYDLYKEGESQVFFFDDFLGKVFLEREVPTNEDERIIKFIERIAKSKNKLFILTTREYILSQAKEKLEALDRPSLEFSKCILDLSQYTHPIRARILYNHLYYSGISP